VLLLPLFADPGRTTVAGVVEIVQASATMPFTNMVEVLSDAFKVGQPPSISPSLPDETRPADPARVPHDRVLRGNCNQDQGAASWFRLTAWDASELTRGDCTSS